MRKKADRMIKTAGIPDGQLFKVKLLADRSGSLGWAWSGGQMNDFTNSVLALTTALDDDGDLDAYVFHSGAEKLKEKIELSNFDGALSRLCGDTPPSGGGGRLFGRMRQATTSIQPIPFGSTNLWDGMELVMSDTRKETDGLPTLCIVATDGAPNVPVEELLKRSSEIDPIFWSFMFIGNDEHGWRYLQKLDNMPGRTRDNSGAFKGDPAAGGANYLDIIRDVPGWLQSVKAAGMVQ